MGGPERLRNRARQATAEATPETPPARYSEPPCIFASEVVKRRGRWYARVTCPRCAAALYVKLSLGPMVARCADCAVDVEADVGRALTFGRA